MDSNIEINFHNPFMTVVCGPTMTKVKCLNIYQTEEGDFWCVMEKDKKAYVDLPNKIESFVTDIQKIDGVYRVLTLPGSDLYITRKYGIIDISGVIKMTITPEISAQFVRFLISYCNFIKKANLCHIQLSRTNIENSMDESIRICNDSLMGDES
jgi:hypothetical protein